MSVEEWMRLCPPGWLRVKAQLPPADKNTESSLPGWMRGIVTSCHALTYVSGDLIEPRTVEIPGGSDAEVVGGMEIFREDLKDSPYLWNKDCYVIQSTGTNTGVLTVVGPLKDGEHWLERIPAGYEAVPIHIVPEPKTKDQ